MPAMYLKQDYCTLIQKQPFDELFIPDHHNKNISLRDTINEYCFLSSAITLAGIGTILFHQIISSGVVCHTSDQSDYCAEKIVPTRNRLEEVFCPPAS